MSMPTRQFDDGWQIDDDEICCRGLARGTAFSAELLIEPSEERVGDPHLAAPAHEGSVLSSPYSSAIR